MWWNGRHASLRSWWGQPLGGSSPLIRTILVFLQIFKMNQNFYIVSAQVIPVLYLAIVQYKAFVEDGPNNSDFLQIPIKTSMQSSLLRLCLGLILLLLPIIFFLGEFLALDVLAFGHVFRTTNYFVIGALVSEVAVLALPYLVNGFIQISTIHKSDFAAKYGKSIAEVLGLTLGVYMFVGIAMQLHEFCK